MEVLSVMSPSKESNEILINDINSPLTNLPIDMNYISKVDTMSNQYLKSNYQTPDSNIKVNIYKDTTTPTIDYTLNNLNSLKPLSEDIYSFSSEDSNCSSPDNNSCQVNRHVKGQNNYMNSQMLYQKNENNQTMDIPRIDFQSSEYFPIINDFTKEYYPSTVDHYHNIYSVPKYRKISTSLNDVDFNVDMILENDESSQIQSYLSGLSTQTTTLPPFVSSPVPSFLENLQYTNELNNINSNPDKSNSNTSIPQVPSQQQPQQQISILSNNNGIKQTQPQAIIQGNNKVPRTFQFNSNISQFDMDMNDTAFHFNTNFNTNTTNFSFAANDPSSSYYNSLPSLVNSPQISSNLMSIKEEELQSQQILPTHDITLYSNSPVNLTVNSATPTIQVPSQRSTSIPIPLSYQNSSTQGAIQLSTPITLSSHAFTSLSSSSPQSISTTSSSASSSSSVLPNYNSYSIYHPAIPSTTLNQEKENKPMYNGIYSTTSESINNTNLNLESYYQKSSLINPSPLISYQENMYNENSNVCNANNTRCRSQSINNGNANTLNSASNAMAGTMGNEIDTTTSSISNNTMKNKNNTIHNAMKRNQGFLYQANPQYSYFTFSLPTQKSKEQISFKTRKILKPKRKLKKTKNNEKKEKIINEVKAEESVNKTESTIKELKKSKKEKDEVIKTKTSMNTISSDSTVYTNNTNTNINKSIDSTNSNITSMASTILMFNSDKIENNNKSQEYVSSSDKNPKKRSLTEKEQENKIKYYSLYSIKRTPSESNISNVQSNVNNEQENKKINNNIKIENQNDITNATITTANNATENKTNIIVNSNAITINDSKATKAIPITTIPTTSTTLNTMQSSIISNMNDNSTKSEGSNNNNNSDGKVKTTAGKEESSIIMTTSLGTVITTQGILEGLKASPKTPSTTLLSNTTKTGGNKVSSKKKKSTTTKKPKPPKSDYFPCTFLGCGKVFNRPYNLKSHIRIHTPERPHKCKYCSACFSRGHDLNRHTRLHTGIKPFECKNCGKRFSRSDALSRHLKVEACIETNQNKQNTKKANNQEKTA